MAFDQGLAQRVREHWDLDVAYDEKRMFGGLVFMVREHMAVGILGNSLMARVGPAYYDTALTQPHVQPMDFTGRPLRGLVVVQPEGLESEPQLAMWLERALSFVASLPDKHR